MRAKNERVKEDNKKIRQLPATTTGMKITVRGTAHNQSGLYNSLPLFTFSKSNGILRGGASENAAPRKKQFRIPHDSLCNGRKKIKTRTHYHPIFDAGTCDI